VVIHIMDLLIGAVFGQL